MFYIMTGKLKYRFLYIFTFAFFCFFSEGIAVAKVNSNFIIGTNYYGFNIHSWTVNYLSAIKESDIDNDFKKIKGMGFNTIIIPASWGEFQPIPGKPSKPAYRKINLIISKAKLNGLNVMIRVPYLWSLAAKDDIRVRTANALISKGSSREELLSFLREFNELVVKKNSNVILVFGSWEDYYLLRDLCFSVNIEVTAAIKEKFTRDTGVKIDKVIYTGENYDVFINWVDTKIEELNKEVQSVFGSYGYEIRVDADPYKKNGKSEWHSHDKFYKNESNGDVVTYWAPYFGQNNRGEKLSSDDALRSFNWMLDLIAVKTTQIPFVDQFNFFDNTPGTELNASIDSKQVDDFFQKINQVMIERTKGYSLWTIRDYRHNIIYNPIFAQGLLGWMTSKNVVINKSNVIIPNEGYVTQNISASSIQTLGSNTASLVVEIESGEGIVEIDSKRVVNITGEGRYTFELNLTQKQVENGFSLTVRGTSNSPKVLSLKSVDLFGHEQIGKIFDSSGNPGEYFNLIKTFNENLLKSSSKPCRQGKDFLDSGFFSNNIYDDGWSAVDVSFCNSKSDPGVGLEIEYYNPVKEKRIVNTRINGDNSRTNILESGAGKLLVCPVVGKSLQEAILSISSPFIPSKVNESSQDIRSLGIKINGISRIRCR